MALYFISKRFIDNCFNSSIHKKYIKLWNKNRSNQPRPYYRFKIIKQDENRYGYIVERKTLPPYFKNAILHMQKDK
jgi:hypothetical protein